MALLTYYTCPNIATREDALRHEVDPRDVPADVKAAADRVGLQIAQHLGLGPVTVRWLPMATAGIRGVVFGTHLHEAWVRLQSRPEAVAETTAHELAHLKQISTRSPMDDREQAADTYGKLIRARFEAGRRLVDPPTPPTPAPAPARRSAAPSVPAAGREAPMLRPDLAAPRTEILHGRKTRVLGKDTYSQCEMCDEWLRWGGLTHRCLAARGRLVPDRRTATGANDERGYRAPSYETKVVG